MVRAFYLISREENALLLGPAGEQFLPMNAQVPPGSRHRIGLRIPFQSGPKHAVEAGPIGMIAAGKVQPACPLAPIRGKCLLDQHSLRFVRALSLQDGK
jgi:hypothetical protein